MKPTLLLDLARVTRLGWSVNVSYGASGYLVQARRVAVGGKLTPTEYDRDGLAFVRDELADAMAQLIMVLVEANEHSRREAS